MLIKKKSPGFTLTEVMVALLLNALLLAALTNIFIANLEHYRKMINANILNETLQNVLQVMTSEIRRAGYSSTAANDVGLNTNTNTFMASGNDISVNGSNNCILFTYDRDGNGSLPSISSSADDERYGYALNTTTNAILTRPPGAAFSCSSIGSWENMTDPTIISITALTFTLNQTTITSGSSLIIRSVDISVTGRLVSDSTITKTLTAHVRVRNDKFVP